MIKFSFDRGRAESVPAICRLRLLGTFALLLAGSFCSAAQAQDSAPAGAVPPAPAGAADDARPESKEIAQLPYQKLVTIARNNSGGAGETTGAADDLEGGAGDEEKEARKLMLRISSTIGVPVDKITLTIMRASGPVEIAIDENGDFEVPWSEELHAENPMVVSNQPQGTMNLRFTIEVPEMRPKVVDGKVRYQELFKQLLAAQKEMRKTNPDFGKPGSETFAIQVVDGGKGVAIERNLGTRTIQPDTAGDVWLVYDLLLFEENPSVTLPEKAQVNIVPVDAHDAIRIRAR